MHKHVLASVATILLVPAFTTAQPIHQSVVHNLSGFTASVTNGVAVDSDGSMIITGWRTDTLDFGGTMHPDGPGAIFLAKFDALGNESWSKVSGSADQNGNHKGMGVAVDGNGNIYNCGWVFAVEQASFDGITLPSGSLGFVAKYTSGGTLLWVKDFAGGVNAIAVDAGGNPFINYGDATIEKLDPANGNSVASATGSGDLQNVLYHNIVIDASNNVIAQWGNKITKYDNALNVLWSTPLTKPTLCESFRVSVDANGDAWASFYAIFGTVSLGGTDYTNFPNGYIYRLDGDDGSVFDCTAPGAFKFIKVFHNSNGDIYLHGPLAFSTPGMLKLDASMVPQWSLTSFNAKDIIQVGEECFVLGGEHSADVTLDGTTYTRPNGPGQENAMAGYLCAGGVGIPEPRLATAFSLFPNPADGRVAITGRVDGPVRVFDAVGALRSIVPDRSNGLDVSNFPPGHYTLRDGSGTTARLLVTH